MWRTFNWPALVRLILLDSLRRTLGPGRSPVDLVVEIGRNALYRSALAYKHIHASFIPERRAGNMSTVLGMRFLSYAWFE